MDLSIERKRALVCGGSKGIEKAITFQLAAKDASTTLLSRNENRFKKAVQDLPNTQNQVHN